MTTIISSWILATCLDGNIICERNMKVPAIKHYEPGKACYIEGVFYQSCPQMNYKK
jgi:hypothetical protein